jgi:TRAP-type mannitol/chloroaromatic compound transport system substrate-binding protein
MTKLTRRSALARFGAAGVIADPSVARAQTQKLRMVTSWPRRLPGPGVSAERVAARIAALSGGRLEVQV